MPRAQVQILRRAHVRERGVLDAEYYRIGAPKRRAYSGFATWKTFIGINHFQLGARAPQLRPIA